MSSVVLSYTCFMIKIVKVRKEGNDGREERKLRKEGRKEGGWLAGWLVDPVCIYLHSEMLPLCLSQLSSELSSLSMFSH